MPDIYAQHRAAFSRVASWIVLDRSTQEPVATVAIKYPADGAGRLYAYVHWIGTPMTRGFANGYGYDKGSAAVSSAVKGVGVQHSATRTGIDWARYGEFCAVLIGDNGKDWTRKLEDAGFRAIQTI